MKLVELTDLNRIESSLLARRNDIVNTTSMFFNFLLLAAVLVGFGFFLYTQYEAKANEVPKVDIPFKPVAWYSATRNVRSEDYSQPFDNSNGSGYGAFAT